MWDIGDSVPVDIEIRGEDGNVADPIALFFSYADPAGLPAAGSPGNADSPLEYGVDGEIVKDSTGIYHIELPATKAGVWTYRWAIYDAEDIEQGVSEGTFIVQASLPYYISISDIRARITSAKLVQLTDFDSLGAADETKINDCIASACGMIDSYCAGRYALPLVVSAQLRDTALAIALYKLHSLRQIAPEKVRQEYEDALSYLRDVANGKASLDRASVTQSVSAGVVTRNHDSNPEVFDNTRLEGF